MKKIFTSFLILCFLFFTSYNFVYAATGTLVPGQKNNTTGNTTINLSFPGNVTAGNTIIVVPRKCCTATPSITDIHDALGNPLSSHLAVGPIRGNPGNATLWVYYADNIIGGTTDQVTVTFSSADGAGLSIYEVSGLNSAGSLDQVSSAVSGSGTPTGGSVTTTVAGGFVLSAVTDDGGDPSAGSGWTLDNVANSNWYDANEYQESTPVATYNGVFSGVTGNYTGVIAAFKPAAATPAIAPPKFIIKAALRALPGLRFK